MRLFWFALSVPLLTFPQTREAEIESARSAKEKTLTPETVSNTERILRLS